VLNIRLNLTSLFRGPGKRRLPDALPTARARITELEAAAVTAEAEHAKEITEVRKALHHGAQQFNALVEDRKLLLRAYEWNVAEVKRLNQILDATDGQPTTAVPALADEPDSFTAVPDPAPVPDFRISDVPPGPTGEAADVNAWTQQVDVRAFRQGWVAAPNAGPVHVPWGVGGPSTRPPLPDEAVTERLSAITAVQPLWQSVPVTVDLTKAVELSPVTGSRARESVHAAVGGAA
jgi:hypothetical protein